QVHARRAARGVAQGPLRRARPRSREASRHRARRGLRHVRPGRLPPLRAARARARALRAPACGDRHRRQPGDGSRNLQDAPRALHVRLAQGFARGAHGARHRAGRHASVQGTFRGARRDPHAPRRPRPSIPPRRPRPGHLRQVDARELLPTSLPGSAMISFETQPDRYHHWKLACDGPVATLTLDVAEDKPLTPGYKLKLNSYDLGVDIELADALNRIRFEHPEVKSVVITSGKSRMFCSGANIYMLGHSSHASKVNFCKFTNETR